MGAAHGTADGAGAADGAGNRRNRSKPVRRLRRPTAGRRCPRHLRRRVRGPRRKPARSALRRARPARPLRLCALKPPCDRCAGEADAAIPAGRLSTARARLPLRGAAYSERRTRRFNRFVRARRAGDAAVSGPTRQEGGGRSRRAEAADARRRSSMNRAPRCSWRVKRGWSMVRGHRVSAVRRKGALPRGGSAR